MGSSQGGLVSYYAILKYPSAFRKVGIFSPSFWFNRKEIIELTNTIPTLETKIYFLCRDNEGNTDMTVDLNQIENLISEKNYKCQNLTKKTIVEGGQHNEKLWREGFLKAYLWIF